MSRDGDEPSGPDGVSRPDPTVLDDRALVPAANHVRPAPNVFTHEVVADEPYWYRSATGAGDPDGTLTAGTHVVVLVRDLVDGVSRCRVVDGRGLYVEVRSAALRPVAAIDAPPQGG
jgi:hypothetical protein